MILKRFILAAFILAFCISSEGQYRIGFVSSESNLGKQVDIQVLGPEIRTKLESTGYRVISKENTEPLTLTLKAVTRQGSETQGIFTSFADVAIILKDASGNVLSERTLSGLKGAGLSFEHAGIDALKKASSKVIAEIIPLIDQNKSKLTINPEKPALAENGTRNSDGLPPQINLISPVLFRNAVIETKNPSVKIEGKVTDQSGILKLTINDTSIDVTPSGSFSYNFPVEGGVTQVIIVAEDLNHNQSSKVFSVNRSIGPAQTQAQTTFSLSASGTGKYYALIIGVNEYEDPAIISLDNPIKDATSLYNALKDHYTFNPENMTFLKNPGREEIIIALDELAKKVSIQDNILIFYAGHGLWDTKKKLGYWLPADAKKANTANWILNSTIQDNISSIPSKHTLLIADACFSGSIFKTKTRNAFNNAPPSIEKLYELASRKAMTSGTMTEVPDKSLFLEYLIKRLEENKQQYLSSEQLFSSFREAVMNNSPNTPQYGIIQDTGDEGGDFIFVRREGLVQ